MAMINRIYPGGLRSRLFLMLFAGAIAGAHAQKKQLPAFGEITMEELEMKFHPVDSGAAALILFDKGDCSLDVSLDVQIKRHFRIKFFTREAIDEWATITRRLDHSDQGLSKIKATSYNLENGQIVASVMNETAIFKTKIDKLTDQVQFTLPNVKEGTVIDVSYVFRSNATLLPPWQFQNTIPSLWSEYTVSKPSYFTFQSEMQGLLHVTEHESDDQGYLERWAMKDIPAFKDEPFISNPEDLVSSISFYLTEVFIPGQRPRNFRTSWQRIANNLVENNDFGLQIDASGFLKKIVQEITAGITDPLEKVKAIHSYVVKNVSWNELIDKIPDRGYKRVLEEKKGSSSEINTLIVSMMRKADLTAYPVLISTRKNGKIKPFRPSFTQFNDVICLVKLGDRNLFLDGTSKFLPYNALPERCLNGSGMTVVPDSAEWIPIASMKARTIVNADIRVAEDGAISGSLKLTRDGIDAAHVRSKLDRAGKQEYLKEAFIGKPWQIEKSDILNVENVSEAVVELHDLKVEDHAQANGPLIYLNPYLLLRIEENTFRSESRLYPVDFTSPFDQFYLAKIEIPEGYTVEEMPETKVYLLPQSGGKFAYSFSSSGNVLSFVSQLTIARTVFKPDEYPSLREFYLRVIAKQAEQVVLRKR